jgi:hypothetical protein
MVEGKVSKIDSKVLKRKYTSDHGVEQGAEGEAELIRETPIQTMI